MKNDIYAMLNEADINLEEYVKDDFNDIEKKNIKANFRKLISKKKSHKRNVIAAGLAVALTVTLFGTNVLANVLEMPQVQDIASFLRIHRNLDEYKTVVNKAITDNGISVQLNEVILDGNELMVSCNITSDKKLYKESFWHPWYFIYVNGKELSYTRSYTIPTNIDDFTTQQVMSFDLGNNDLSGDLNIKILCSTINVDDVAKDGSWNFEFKTNGDALKIDTKEMSLNNKFILENGEVYTLEKYTDNSLCDKIYASLSNLKKESAYHLELNGTDDLGNKIQFRVKYNALNGVIFELLKIEDICGNVNENAKTLTLTPVQAKDSEQIGKIGEYKQVGESFTIDLSQLK